MSTQRRFSLIVMSTLLASSMLAGCSGSSNGSTNNAAPSKVSSASIMTTPSSSAALVPTAYTPESGVGVVTTCNIEKFDRSNFQLVPIEAALSTTHSVGGWIAAPQLTNPSFSLRLDDKAQNHYFEVPADLTVKRPDVVSSADNSSVPLVSGFVLNLPANAVPVGLYHLYLAVQAGGKTSVCDSGRQVDFK